MYKAFFFVLQSRESIRNKNYLLICILRIKLIFSNSFGHANTLTGLTLVSSVEIRILMHHTNRLIGGYSSPAHLQPTARGWPDP
jgi:hypothetical protein